MNRDNRSYRFVMTLVIVLASVILIYDLAEIVLGRVDLGRHLPLFLPVVLYFLAYATYRVEHAGQEKRGVSRPSDPSSPDDQV